MAVIVLMIVFGTVSLIVGFLAIAAWLDGELDVWGPLVFASGVFLFAFSMYGVTQESNQNDIDSHSSLKKWGQIVWIDRSDDRVKFTDGRICDYEKSPDASIDFFVIKDSCVKVVSSEMEPVSK